MQIRTRLTLQFLLIGSIIMIVASTAIYYFSADFRRDDFYNILRSRAISIAKLVLDSYEYNPNRILRTGTDYPSKLTNEKYIILNYNNDTIYISDRFWVLNEMNTITGLVNSDKEVFLKQDEYEVLGTTHATGLYKFVVIGAAIDENGLLHLKKLKVILILVCLISLVLFSIAGWFYSGRALKPISDVVEKVDEISITSLHLRVPEGNGVDEIGRLAGLLTECLKGWKHLLHMQKNFIANASHELRTPLTSINGQLEVLMMKDRTTDEYKSSLGSVLEDIKSLIDLSNRLLLIARTSAEGPSKYSVRLRIDEILWQSREEIKKFNPGYHINILPDKSLTDSDQMIVKGDEYLLKVALSNIMDNGCKYSPDHTVDVRLRYSDKSIEIVFEDKGIGIPAEDAERILEPFQRGTNAIPYSGTGIGLSLVNQIIKNHNGTLEISSQVGKGTKVIIMLPATPYPAFPQGGRS